MQKFKIKADFTTVAEDFKGVLLNISAYFNGLATRDYGDYYSIEPQRIVELGYLEILYLDDKGNEVKHALKELITPNERL